MRDVSFQPELDSHDAGQPVTIAGIDIPFRDMVWFMVKWAVAAVPAAVILFLLGVFLLSVIGRTGRM